LQEVFMRFFKRVDTLREADAVAAFLSGIAVHVVHAELARRRTTWKAPQKPARGYTRLYVERVTQADKGCDFDFLMGTI
jgi:DNA-directed RNA polymerase specialized sigma24 family protein